jgi:regulator of RNase E activity RraA
VDLAARLKDMPTSTLCDVSIKLASRRVERMIMRGLKPLTIQSRAVGRARTQQVVAIRDRARSSGVANWPMHVGLSRGAKPGDVLVIAVAGIEEVASFGDVIAAQALAKGATGAIVDGYIRDVAAIDRMGFPVWSMGTSMIPQGSLDYSVQSIDEPITCGGVEVRPGDWIVADGDGVIVLPEEEAEAICAAAEEIVAKENAARTGIEAGGDIAALYPKRAFDDKR